MKIVRMNFEIPNDLRKKLKEKLAKEGRSIKWFYLKQTEAFIKEKR